MARYKDKLNRAARSIGRAISTPLSCRAESRHL